RRDGATSTRRLGPGGCWSARTRRSDRALSIGHAVGVRCGAPPPAGARGKVVAYALAPVISPHPPTIARPAPASLRVRLEASAQHSARAFGLVWSSAPGGVMALVALTLAAAALPPF